MTAPAPGSEAHFAVPPDLSFHFFEKNDCCLKGNNKSKPILEIDSSIQISDENSATKGISTSGLWHITLATHTIPSFCKLSIKHPSDTSSIKHPFGATRNYGLHFTISNLLRPNLKHAKYILPTNKNLHLKLLFLALEQQQPGRRAYSSTLKNYNDILERSNNQFDRLIAPEVIFYFIKSRLHMDGDTTNTEGTTRFRYTNIVSAANEIEWAFLVRFIFDKEDTTTTLEVYTVPTILEVYNIPTTLEVYNIPGNILEGDIPTTLEVYTIPITLEAYNIPENILEAYNILGNILEACNIPTTDSTLEIYDIPGNMLEVYNILNTRDNFAGNFDTRAGSSDRLTSDPVLATSGCLKVSDNFQPCKFGIYI